MKNADAATTLFEIDLMIQDMAEKVMNKRSISHEERRRKLEDLDKLRVALSVAYRALTGSHLLVTCGINEELNPQNWGE